MRNKEFYCRSQNLLRNCIFCSLFFFLIMIRVVAFFTTILSIVYHVCIGSIYAIQPNPRVTKDFLDPCGFMSIVRPPSSTLHAFWIVYFRILGLFMIAIGLSTYVEVLGNLNFKPIGRLGLVHFFYMMLHLISLRSERDLATFDYCASWFIFHLFMMLTLLQFKRFRYPDWDQNDATPPRHVTVSDTSTDEDDHNYVHVHEDEVPELISSSSTTSHDSNSYADKYSPTVPLAPSSPSESSTSSSSELVVVTRRVPVRRSRSGRLLHTKQD